MGGACGIPQSRLFGHSVRTWPIRCRTLLLIGLLLLVTTELSADSAAFTIALCPGAVPSPWLMCKASCVGFPSVLYYLIVSDDSNGSLSCLVPLNLLWEYLVLSYFIIPLFSSISDLSILDILFLSRRQISSILVLVSHTVHGMVMDVASASVKGVHTLPSWVHVLLGVH